MSGFNDIVPFTSKLTGVVWVVTRVKNIVIEERSHDELFNVEFPPSFHRYCLAIIIYLVFSIAILHPNGIIPNGNYDRARYRNECNANFSLKFVDPGNRYRVSFLCTRRTFHSLPEPVVEFESRIIVYYVNVLR